jgi:hypothetical protein
MAELDTPDDALDINGEPVQRTIRELVNHKVAVTSTLAVFENAPPLQTRFLDALSATAALNSKRRSSLSAPSLRRADC